MMAPVVSGNKVPLYRQIAQAIRQRVRTGVYKSGAPLPSVRAMSREFGASVRVVHLAMHNLEKHGILTTHPGKGMTVARAEPCERAAILFGFVQPYTPNLAFESQVFHYAGQVFNDRDNFLVMRSSGGSAEQERDVARHFIANGVQGLLLWPIENDPNGRFFAEVSRQVPVVVVDRQLEGSELPTIIHDNYANGRGICRQMFKERKRRRLLALIDNLRISPYRDLIQGLHDEAAELGRMSDLTILQLPITDFLARLGKTFTKEVGFYRPYIERLLTEGDYDALFCPQGEFVDYVVVETGLYRQFPDLAMGILCGTGADPNLAKLAELGVLQWVMDHPGMISRAANLLQQWVLSRQPPKGVLKMEVSLKVPPM